MGALKTIWALVLSLLAATTVRAGEQPNILWITIEDTSPHFVGCYGNSAAHTPVIDRLAETGVRFTHAFSTGTVCSPSRTALITGVKTYQAGTGHHRSSVRLPDFMKGFPYFMRQQGYHTSNNSKTDYNIRDERRYIEEAWSESNGKAGWWNRKAGQPFFSVFNFNASHQSKTMTEPYDQYERTVLAQLDSNEVVGDEDFSVPPFYRDSPEMRKQLARVYNALSLTDKRIGALLDRLREDRLMDSTIIIFFGDHGEGIPRGKTNGINLGFRVPFVIWFPEMYKHLSPWGTGGTVTDELVDFTDLAPTMIALAGGTVPSHMTGRVFMGDERGSPADHLVLSSDRSDNGIDLVRVVTDGNLLYARNFMPFMPEVRYIRYMEIGEIKQQMRKDLAAGKLDSLQSSLFAPRPAEFLFDLRDDPWETRNLVTDHHYRTELERMQELLEAEMIGARDILLVPEGELNRLSDSVTPYEYRQDDERFPIHEIYRAATLCGFSGERFIRKQLALLEHPNRMVRYWAAIGLHCQSQEDLRPHMDRIFQGMNDGFPPVAITLAAIVYQYGNHTDAKACLDRFILGDNQDWALLGVNYLLYGIEKEPFVDVVRRSRLLPERGYPLRAACMDFLGSMGLVPNDMEHRQ